MTVVRVVEGGGAETGGCKRIGNVLVLPDAIETETFLSVLELTEDRQPIDVYIAGSGGNIDTGIMIGEYLKSIDARGVLTGPARSAHSVIWAMCPTRVMYRYASIGVHQVYIHGAGDLSLSEAEDFARSLRSTNNHLIEIYEAASQRNAMWWREQLRESFGPLCEIHAPELVEIGMGEYLFA